jgi:hypothetical protein
LIRHFCGTECWISPFFFLSLSPHAPSSRHASGGELCSCILIGIGILSNYFFFYRCNRPNHKMCRAFPLTRNTKDAAQKVRQIEPASFRHSHRHRFVIRILFSNDAARKRSRPVASLPQNQCRSVSLNLLQRNNVFQLVSAMVSLRDAIAAPS